MPKPPILPQIEWKKIYESGADWNAWQAAAENPEHRQKMEDKRAALSPRPLEAATLHGLDTPVYVIAIAEDWCGDVVRHAPVLQKMADLAPNLHVRFIAREQHPDVFAHFLTNGGEAIPKFVFLSRLWVECGNWGPMPARHRELIARGKACGDIGAARKKVSALYEADPECREVFEELLHLVDIAATMEV